MEENDLNKKSITTHENLMKLFLAVWQGRWMVLWITLGFTLIGVGASLVWPKTYQATATVFPVSSSSSSSLSDYVGLASLAGINLPVGGAGNGPGKTVNALLGSRVLIETLVKDMNLMEKLKTEGKTAAERERNLVEGLKKNLTTKEDSKTGVISVAFELSDPEMAQAITNQILDVLDRLLVEKSFTTNKKKREQLDHQVEEQGKKLAVYQNEMAQFQKETTMLNPAAQAGKAVDAYTSMIQQRMELELQLSTAQTLYSADNPRITLLLTQLKSLEGQIETVKNQVGGDMPSLKRAPENMIRYQNLARDLEISTKIYAGLLANVEQMRLESDKDQVYIEVLDKALLPATAKPSRSMIAVTVAVSGFFLAILGVFLLQGIKSLRTGSRGQLV